MTSSLMRNGLVVQPEKENERHGARRIFARKKVVHDVSPRPGIHSGDERCRCRRLRMIPWFLNKKSLLLFGRRDVILNGRTNAGAPRYSGFLSSSPFAGCFGSSFGLSPSFGGMVTSIGGVTASILPVGFGGVAAGFT